MKKRTLSFGIASRMLLMLAVVFLLLQLSSTKLQAATRDLSKLTADYTAYDGDVLTGTLNANCKISISNGATVTLQNAEINGTDDDCKWAGITCLGNATIILSGNNKVKGFDSEYPGIFVPKDNKLTISGQGSLEAGSNGTGAGIGGGAANDVKQAGNIEILNGNITAIGDRLTSGIGAGRYGSCQNITISGGQVYAEGKGGGAGIGCGDGHSTIGSTCGDITINGGIVTAIGSSDAAAIGSGSTHQQSGDHHSICGKITISSTVIKVFATRGGENAEYIGKGKNSYCGTVTIDSALKRSTDGDTLMIYNQACAMANAKDVTVDYDGQPHGITVNVVNPQSGASIKYGTTKGSYTLDASPLITNVSESPLTVYYKVTATGYEAVEGSATVTIKRAWPKSPEKPKAVKITKDSVTLSAIPNCEYAKADYLWQESPVFEGLSRDTEYTFYARYKEDENHYASSSKSITIRTNKHDHDWTYTANGAMIIAACQNSDGYHEGNSRAIINIVKPEHATFGDGKNASATVDDFFEGVTEYPFVYKNGTQVLSGPPTDAGTYTVSLTLGTATASVEYTIAAVPATITTKPTASAINVGQALSDSVLSGGEGSVPGTFEWTMATAKPTLEDSNKTEYYVVFKPTDTNYSEAICKVTLTVNPAGTGAGDQTAADLAAPKLSSAKNSKSKSIALKWKKVSGAKGYEIQYSTKKNFKKNSKTKTTKKVKYTIKSLKKKKTYYVRVRAYKTDASGNKVYGAWSKAKKVTIKK